MKLEHCLPLGDMIMATVITQNARNQLTAIIEDFGSFFLGKGSTQARALSGRCLEIKVPGTLSFCRVEIRYKRDLTLPA